MAPAITDKENKGVPCASSREVKEAKVGQTKFTVYRHKVFDFACGRVVIIQISNQ